MRVWRAHKLTILAKDKNAYRIHVLCSFGCPKAKATEVVTEKVMQPINSLRSFGLLNIFSESECVCSSHSRLLSFYGGWNSLVQQLSHRFNYALYNRCRHLLRR